MIHHQRRGDPRLPAAGLGKGPEDPALRHGRDRPAGSEKKTQSPPAIHLLGTKTPVPPRRETAGEAHRIPQGTALLVVMAGVAQPTGIHTLTQEIAVGIIVGVMAGGALDLIVRTEQLQAGGLHLRDGRQSIVG